jgi:nucleoside transporter
MPSTPTSVKVRLALMMFLQYFVQGSYLSIVFAYLRQGLGFSESESGNFVAAIGVGPLLAPFVVGQLVDRMLPTERVLAGCHFLAGLLMIVLYLQTQYLPVLILGACYSILYVPTMMLTNTLAFRHLVDRDREFPRLRLWGTIGFIVPAWLIEFYFLSGFSGDELNRRRGIAFLVSGIAGVIMSAYCLTLPSTPPTPQSSGKFAPGVVLGLLRQRNFFVLTLVTFVIAGAHNFFFVWNVTCLQDVLGRIGWAGKVQSFATIAQIAEIVVMLIVGTSIVRLGYKWTMAIGMAAYALRCVALAVAGDGLLPPMPSMILAGFGNALHGVCFGFFLATAFMYVNNTSPPDVKGSMQTIYGTLIFGLGGVLGANLAGHLGKFYKLADTSGGPAYDWNGIWLWCAAAAAACLLVFIVAFPKTKPESTS